MIAVVSEYPNEDANDTLHSGVGMHDESACSTSGDNDPLGDFFQSLQADKSASEPKARAKRMVERYLEGELMPPISLMQENSVMRKLFIKFNTPIPSSAAVERLFSLGKDILRPKRGKMTDEHFEMMLFLKD